MISSQFLSFARISTTYKKYIFSDWNTTLITVNCTLWTIKFLPTEMATQMDME